MKGLSRESRALLDAARAGDEPSAVDRKRVRKGLARKLAVGLAAGAVAATASQAAAGGVATTTSASATAVGVATGVATGAVAAGGASVGASSIAASVLASGFGVKVLASIAIVGAMSAGTVGYVRHEAAKRAETARQGAVASAPRAPRDGAMVTAGAPARGAALPSRTPATLAVPAPAPEPPTTLDEPRRVIALDEPRRVENDKPAPARAIEPIRQGGSNSVSASSASSASATNSGANNSGASPTSDLDVELALLQEAHGALRANDGARALRILDEHSRRFPNGALAEESEAARVFALRQVGRADEARDVAARFLREHPRSPLAPRVTRAFETEPSTF